MARAARRRRVLDRRHARHHREVVLGLDVLQQAQPLGLDDLLLDVARPVARQTARRWRRRRRGAGRSARGSCRRSSRRGGPAAGRTSPRTTPASAPPRDRSGAPSGRGGRSRSPAWHASARAWDRARRGSRSPSRRRCSWPAAPGPATTSAGRRGRRGPRGCGRPPRPRGRSSRRTAGCSTTGRAGCSEAQRRK